MRILNFFWADLSCFLIFFVILKNNYNERNKISINRYYYVGWNGCLCFMSKLGI